jgi:transglutaminase-like putative cysteine protease
MIGRSAAALLFLALGSALAAYLYLDRKAPEYPIEREIRYGFTLRNRSADLLHDVELRVYAPVSETATQRSASLDASHPFELESDALGNRVMRFRLTLPPGGRKELIIRAKVELSDAPYPGRVAPGSEHTQPELHIESDHPEIERVAQVLGGSSARDRAMSAYEWVTGHVRDTGFVREDRGALWALREGTGDCTEFAYLFAALARASGVPARGVGGFVVEGNSVVHAADYHNWAEFHADGVWQIADPQRAVFSERPSRYIAMRITGHGETAPLSSSQRFASSDPRLEVRMN